MRKSGEYLLGNYALTTALTGEVITSQSSGDPPYSTYEYLDGMEDMIHAGLSVNFVYGSGGTTCRVMVETSRDGGTTWIEVWRALFTTASENNQVNLSAATPVTTPYTPAALSDDTVKDGIFGALWRAKITSTGTYAGNTSVSVRLAARMASAR